MSILPNSSEKFSPKHATLVCQIVGKREKHALLKLRDPEYRGELDQRFKANYGAVKVQLSGIVDWPESVRLDGLIFLAEHNGNIEFFAGKNKPAGTDLYNAILRAIPTNDDLNRFEAAKVAALEAAALLHPHALDGACDLLVKRLRELGIKGVNLRDLVTQVKRIATEIDQHLSDPNVDEQVLLKETFADLPIEQPLQVPHGWTINTEGIGRRGYEIVVPAPVIISARQLDIDDDTELVTLNWLRDGAWKTKTVARGTIASARLIVEELAPFGCPVTSNNATDLVQFLMAFESTNLVILKTSKVTRQLGWQGKEGGGGFLLGQRHLLPTVKGDTTTTEVQFRGADVGDSQIADGFSCEGSLEEWIKVVRKLRHYPQVMLAIYASMTAPFLQMFCSPNFLLSLAGRTSSGKTTALRLAASVWGNPNEQDRCSVLKTWSGTATWRERVPAILNNLPFILDDTKHALHHDDVAKTVYSIAQGVGKGRGSQKGLAQQQTWRTVGITSGEQPLTSFTQDGGTRARVLSLWGTPFGESSPAMGKLVRRVDAKVREHFGHAGEALIQYALEHPEDWAEWRKEYQAELKKFEAWAAAENNPFAGRMATHFAAIVTTAWIAHDALELPWEYTDPVEPLWEDLVNEAGEANRAAAALRYVMDWAWAHQHEFDGRQDTILQSPSHGWAGKWKKSIPLPDQSDQIATWEWIGFLPTKLKSLLHEGGFDADAIIRTWKDDAWLVTDDCEDGKARCTKKTRLGKEKSPVNVIAIRRGAVQIVAE